jgi:hypothetical protein
MSLITLPSDDRKSSYDKMKIFLNNLKNKYDIYNPPEKDRFYSLKNFLNRNHGSFKDSQVLN